MFLAKAAKSAKIFPNREGKDVQNDLLARFALLRETNRHPPTIIDQINPL